MPASFDNSEYVKRFGIEEWPENEWWAELAKLDAELLARHCAIDYSSTPAYNNVAIYTPALSQGWINTIDRAINDPANNQLPKLPDFQLNAEDLQFTNPKSRLCFYPWVLYSAGQAVDTNPNKSNPKTFWKNNWLTQKPRDPRVVVICDSGGFQIQEQTLAFDGENTVKRILNWLEETADQSMAMDFPTGKIAMGNLVPHTRRLIAEGIPIEEIAKRSGFDSGFITCLIQTIRNNRTYIRERINGATNMLNVIQGRNEKESREWYERVKGFNFEGWSFAGKHHSELTMTLRRLISMRDAGLLGRCNWIHFLGVSTFKVAAVLTFVQRALRNHTDAKNVQISFDSKSPIDSVITGYRPVVGYDFNPDKWSFRVETLALSKCINNPRMLNQVGKSWQQNGPNRYIANTALSYRLRLDQLVNRIQSTGAIQPNSLQQAMLIHHNTQVYFEGFRRAYGYLDDKRALQRPPAIKHIDLLIDAVFRTETPMSFIDQAEQELDALVYERM